MIDKNILPITKVNFTELGYDTPGGNYIINGNCSGEEYYEKFFQSKLHDAMISGYKIIFTDEKLYGLPLIYFRTIIELAIETYGVKLISRYIDIDKSNIELNRKILFNDIINYYSNESIDYKHPDNLRYAKRYN